MCFAWARFARGVGDGSSHVWVAVYDEVGKGCLSSSSWSRYNEKFAWIYTVLAHNHLLTITMTSNLLVSIA